MPEHDRYLSEASVAFAQTVAPPPVLEEVANSAGVEFNGNAPWDIHVYDSDVYRRLLTQGSLGLGEAYMDGLWDTQALDELFFRLLRADVGLRLGGRVKLKMGVEAVRQTVFNLQSCTRAFQVAREHYDIGNDVFEAMLDSTMTYSCGYWEHAQNLEEAQQHKLDLICRKLKLRPGEQLLDIGCGWGGLAKFAAEHYGVEVTGVTVSKEQQKLAQERCTNLPVDVQLMDYRDLNGLYDKIVSVGMFEHVGPKNYAVYFDTVSRLLKEDGLFLLHTIGAHSSLPPADPWLDRYIFPNGKLPSAKDVSAVIEGRFLIEDWHNFGQDYDRTLMAWWQRFNAAWPQLEARYDRRFYRMWKYYLHCCAGYFRSRRGQLWQLVLTKQNRDETYRSVR
jgi:cyclopropane-fatty-acyl-phospholipid synthase